MPSFKIIGLLLCRRRFLKVLTIYGHGGHLGHVTWTIYINFLSPFLRRLHMKFGDVSEKMFENNIFENDMFGKNNINIHVYSPGTGVDDPLGYFFHKHNYSVNLILCCNFYPLNNFGTLFPIQTYRPPNLSLL